MSAGLSRQSIATLAFFFVIGLVLLREQDIGTFRDVDAAFVDWLAANSRSTGSIANMGGPKLLLVEINNETRSQEWPLTLLDYAAFLRAAAVAKAPLAAIEQVVNPIRGGEVERAALENALLQLPQVLLAWRIGGSSAQTVLDRMGPVIRATTGDLSQVPPLGALNRIPPEDLHAITVAGLIADIPARNPPEVPLLFRNVGEIIPAFVLRAIMLAYRLSADELRVTLGEAIRLQNGWKIPINPRGFARLQPSAFGAFARIELGELILRLNEAEQDEKLGLHDFQGHIFLLGRTDDESQIHPVGDGRKASSAELFAAAIASLRPRPAATPTGVVVNVLIVTALGLLLLLFLRLEHGTSLLVLLLAAATYPIFALILYEHFDQAPPFVLPYGLLLLAGSLRLFHPNRRHRVQKQNRISHEWEE